jgi:hypothetical protein
MFAAEFEPAVIDRRRTPRAPVSLDAKLGKGGLGRALCKVVDLSQHGARLQTYSGMRPGSTIWLTLPGLPPIAADVRWADDFAAGCQFREPLSLTHLEQLVDRQAP